MLSKITKLKACFLGILLLGAAAHAADTGEGRLFPKSPNIELKKVSFKNQYNMKVAGNLFVPKNLDKKKAYPAIVVGHPMGAVKEQAASLYAFKMAEMGYVALAFDFSYWGESEGEPRNSVLPDVYVEDFSAAVDYLGSLPYVDREKIGGIGICASGGFVISAAKIDPRIKAITTVSMYDMGAANRDGLNKSVSLEARKAIIAEAANARWDEFKGGKRALTSGSVHEITEKSTDVEKEFYSYYRTELGEFTPKGATKETTTHPTLSSNVKFMNFYPFNDLELISPRPLLFITGDKAHSKEFSEEAYKRASQPKELMYIKGANHVDLYYDINKIPFTKITEFFNKNLK
ncbi:alpha/beta hydrolase [Campylobacter sp. MIT 19-121]|uniref:alpha/beta hydrolase n=1 Tax=Campylobacter sp. MIT 19-121 TaxID=2703906 RepID=UPI00138A2EE7|nr:alpha/beta hydrolase [Campylobacter sp. MIT 19-121]NDJ27108.1 alpha/beta hydrolase [Campylobacter sp. MIT 19-121]